MTVSGSPKSRLSLRFKSMKTVVPAIPASPASRTPSPLTIVELDAVDLIATINVCKVYPGTFSDARMVAECCSSDAGVALNNAVTSCRTRYVPSPR